MSLLHHRAMIADAVRCQAYQQALAMRVRPGDRVLDLGAGSGLLGFFALQAGAAHVYAIECNPDALERARELAQANGWQKRITWLQGTSTELTVPEAVDGIVSETLGNLAIDEDNPRYLADARARFLKPDGWIIPEQVTILLAPVELAAAHASLITFWTKPHYQMNWTPLHALAANARYQQRLPADAPLAAPRPVQTIDYRSIAPSPASYAFETTVMYEAQRDGVCHGLGGWFEARLTAGITLSTAPQLPETHWSHMFFPLHEACPVRAGDVCRVQVSARPLARQLVWSWNVCWERAGRTLLLEHHSTAHIIPSAALSQAMGRQLTATKAAA